MQDRKYHKIRLSAAKKDYIKLLKDHLPMEILSIGIPTIPNIILGKIYYTITSALLYEFGFLVIVFGGLFFWKSLRIIPERIYNKQQDIISTKQKTIEFLEERQKPKLEIGFDLKSCFNDTGDAYVVTEEGKPNRIEFPHEWSIFVRNTSTTKTIKNVEVKLIDINKCLSGDARNLPEVHLKFAHDNNRERRSVSINPNSRQFVDVIVCYMKSSQRSENIFWVQHIEKNERHADLRLFYDNIDKENCEIRIEVTGENTTCKPKNFTIGLKNKVIKMWEA